MLVFIKNEYLDELKELTFENAFTRIREMIKQNKAVEVPMNLKSNPLLFYKEIIEDDNWTIVHFDLG